MQLVLNTFGAYLHRQGEMFRIKVGEEIKEVSSRKVSSILIATAATLSTDAIQLAVEKNIDIVFLDKFGDPFGRVWHGRPGSTTRIRREQLRLMDTKEGLAFAKEWIGLKLERQIGFLEEMRERRTRLSAELTAAANQLKDLSTSLSLVEGTVEEVRGTIMGLEGTAGRIYFASLSKLLPDRFQFEGRSRNPAKDEFNCLLNYAYGVLYGTVERAALLAGLDPYIGFVHTDHYNKKSLVFDLIEPYRIWADEAVTGLFAAKKITQALFDALPNGFVLNKEGKATLMERFAGFLDEAIRYRGRNIKRRDTIQFDCHRFANQLIGSTSSLQVGDANEADGDPGVDTV